MDDRQFNAIRACEQRAAVIAQSLGLRRPQFMYPAGDSAIEFWKSLEAVNDFLGEVIGAQVAPVSPEPEPTPEPVKKKKAKA